MQNTTYKIDKGENFGKWNDSTSKFMYETSFEIMMNLFPFLDDSKLKIGDFGGANGLIKNHISNAITIDIDSTKKPDITDNILTHSKKYDVAISRYVLHYLTDNEVLKFVENLKKHCGKIIFIQFTNNDLHIKQSNSVNETKYFRTPKQLQTLLKDFTKIASKEYIVSNEFYKNRLNLDNATSHSENLEFYYYAK